MDSSKPNGSTGATYQAASPKDNQAIIHLVEKVYCVFSIIFFCGGIENVLGTSPTLMTLLRYSILGFAIILLAARWKTTLRTFSKGTWLWMLTGMSFLSIVWSIAPAFTLESLRGELPQMAGFALYFSSRFKMREQMRLLAIALSIGAVASLFYSVAVPSIGRHVGDKFDGAWKGIYGQKNSFSVVMALTMLLFYVLSLSNSNKRERLLARCGLGFSIAMILMSTSLSGLLIFILMLMIMLAFRSFRWQGRRSILLLDLVSLGMLCTVVPLLSSWQDIVIGMGKDPTLSARTVIWSGSLKTLMEKPLLGFGRGALWVEGSQRAQAIGAVAHRDFVPAHAHNGYVDVLMEVGMIGFAIFLVGLLLTYGLSIRRAYKANTPEDLWPFAFLSMLLIYNMTESLFMFRTSIYWVIYMTVFLSLRRWPRTSNVP